MFSKVFFHDEMSFHYWISALQANKAHRAFIGFDDAQTTMITHGTQTMIAYSFNILAKRLLYIGYWENF